MKKIYLIVSFLLVLTACSQNEMPEMPSQPQLSEVSIPGRSVADAIEIACSVKDIPSTMSRSDLNVSVKAITRNSSRSESSDTLIYVVEFEDNGFVLVSKPMTVKPVLGIVEEGAFDDAATQSNEGFQDVMSNAKLYVEAISTASSSGPLPIDPRPVFYNDTTVVSEKVPARIKAKWNQYWPENIYVPNKVAGCVPVAMAMILSYFEEPKTMPLTFDGADKSTLALDWTKLKKHVTSLAYKNPSESQIATHIRICADLETHKDLGRLVRQLGHLSGSNYNSSSSTPTPWNTSVNVLKGLLPGKTFLSESYFTDFKPLFDLLTKDGVSYVYGARDGGAHAFVIDGTWKYGLIVKFYEMSPFVGGGGDYVLTKTTTSVSEYLHVNWGWGGNSNGYFLLGVLDPDNAYRYDKEYDFPIIIKGDLSRANYNKSNIYLYIK